MACAPSHRRPCQPVVRPELVLDPGQVLLQSPQARARLRGAPRRPGARAGPRAQPRAGQARSDGGPLAARLGVDTLGARRGLQHLQAPTAHGQCGLANSSRAQTSARALRLLGGHLPQLSGQRPLADAGPHQARSSRCSARSRPAGVRRRRRPMAARAARPGPARPQTGPARCAGARPGPQAAQLPRGSGGAPARSAPGALRAQTRAEARGPASASARSAGRQGASGSLTRATAPAASSRSVARCLAWRAPTRAARASRARSGSSVGEVGAQVDAVARAGHVGPLGRAALGRGQQEGAVHRRPLADVPGDRVAVVGVLQVVGRQLHLPRPSSVRRGASRPRDRGPRTVPRVPLRTSTSGR